jgi:hypothetical protein
MPFIVDLPPKPVHELNTKIEYVFQNEKNVRTSSIDAFKLDEDLIDNVHLYDKFQTLLCEWQNNTVFESSILKIIEDDNFQQIVGLKEKVIPFIIDEIEKEPSVLVWALNMITNATVSFGQRNTIEDICKVWVKYYRQGRIKVNNNNTSVEFVK